MATVATLVLGIDGSSALNGNSDGVSSMADREQFLIRRRASDCLIIGGNTARSDRYRQTPVPLVILSRSRPDLIAINPQVHWWNLSPAHALVRARAEFGEKILIEAGVSIITELLALGLVDQLELSITPASRGEKKIDAKELLQHFRNIQTTQVGDTTFHSCSEIITSPR
jgi:riboflavin biosynthesis pyrimidine reductase